MKSHCLDGQFIKQSLATIREEFTLKNLSLTPDCSEEESDEFLSFQWCSSKKVNAVYRAALFLYCAAWLGFDLALHNCDENYFYYLSNWVQFVAVLYLGVSFLYSIILRFKGLQPIVWGFFNVYVTLAIGICIAALVGQDHVYGATRQCPLSLTIHVHVIIAVIALCDVMLTKVEVRLLHAYLPMLFSSVYVIFTLIAHWAGGVSNIYPEYLDWAAAPQLAIAVSLGLIFLGCPIVHLLVYCVFKARVFVDEKHCGDARTS